MTVANNIISRVKDLPAVSTVATKLLNIIDDPKTTRDEVLKLIALDQVLFLNAFKYANSAAIGAVRRLETLTEIVDILGFNIIKNIAVLTAFRTAIVDQDYWFKNVFLATASKALAEKLNKSGQFCNDIYMAALFLSYGDYAFKNLYPVEFKEVEKQNNFFDKMNKEEELFGINGIDLTVQLLDEWGVPKRVIAIIKDHLITTEDDTEHQTNRIINLAKNLLDFEGVNDVDYKFKMEELNTEGLELEKEFLDELFEHTHELISI